MTDLRQVLGRRRSGARSITAMLAALRVTEHHPRRVRRQLACRRPFSRPRVPARHRRRATTRRAPSYAPPQYASEIECVITPWLVADTAVSRPVAIPTCDAPGPAVLKKTRSPARMWPRATRTPAPAWAKLECGSDTPARRIAHAVRPEQSNARGPLAPNTYEEPIRERTARTAVSARRCTAMRRARRTTRRRCAIAAGRTAAPVAQRIAAGAGAAMSDGEAARASWCGAAATAAGVAATATASPTGSCVRRI